MLTGFELATRKFELVTRGFELLTRRFELVTCWFERITHGLELLTRRFELVTCEFQHVTRKAELITRGFELDLNPIFLKSVRIRSYSGPHFRSIIRSISPYSVRMRENADHNNSEYVHFLRSDHYALFQKLWPEN